MKELFVDTVFLLHFLIVFGGREFFRRDVLGTCLIEKNQFSLELFS